MNQTLTKAVNKELVSWIKTLVKIESQFGLNRSWIKSRGELTQNEEKKKKIEIIIQNKFVTYIFYF